MSEDFLQSRDSQFDLFQVKLRQMGEHFLGGHGLENFEVVCVLASHRRQPEDLEIWRSLVDVEQNCAEIVGR